MLAEYLFSFVLVVFLYLSAALKVDLLVKLLSIKTIITYNEQKCYPTYEKYNLMAAFR